MTDQLYDRISDGMAYLDATRTGWIKHAVDNLTSVGGEKVPAYVAAVGSYAAGLELIDKFGMMWVVMNGYICDENGVYGDRVYVRDLDRAWRRRIVARIGR